MNCREGSQKIIPLASIWVMPRSVPRTSQEEARYGEPRQRTHWWLTATFFKFSGGSKNRTTATENGGLAKWKWKSTKSPWPVQNRKVCWFRYPSCINHFINNFSQVARWYRQVIQTLHHRLQCPDRRQYALARRRWLVPDKNVRTTSSWISWSYRNHL